jgi:hypothetical protein
MSKIPTFFEILVVLGGRGGERESVVIIKSINQ